jgi:predicted ArsR family transcriptional regulator
MDMKSNSGRKKLKDDEMTFSNVRRNIIFSLKDNPKSIRDLEKELKINRGTLKHHLKILKEHKVIKITRKKDLSGQPVSIELIKGEWTKFFEDMNNILQESIKKFEAIKK